MKRSPRLKFFLHYTKQRLVLMLVMHGKAKLQLGISSLPYKDLNLL